MMVNPLYRNCTIARAPSFSGNTGINHYDTPCSKLVRAVVPTELTIENLGGMPDDVQTEI